MKLAKLYPSEFSPIEVMALDSQLENYIIDMRSDARFLQVKGINELSSKLVEMRRHIVYPLVYFHVKLALILLVVTTTLERTFSTMNIIKNRMEDEWLNDCLVTYIEKDIFDSIDNEKLIQRYQTIRPCREQL
ncbi:Zinc finger MYM-type protein 1-like [Quillaja saponaria]|uniref:Zinc finger MYM-type protein 1-like n=1 Tax=Quillaja saponaria TaxID=32244 RepID=A0AAD7VP49_QUISA|nr:Zinc finger MYM-type protein 1-like [Quillaja saponaria]